MRNTKNHQLKQLQIKQKKHSKEDHHSQSAEKAQKKEINILKPQIIANTQKFLSGRHFAVNFVGVSRQSLLDTLDIYEWRQNTDYPVIRTIWTGIAFNKISPIIRNKARIESLLPELSDNISKFYVEVHTQKGQPLVNHGLLTFSMYAYAFKEALVGFERLYALFGAFTVGQKNIVVNKDGKVKVWISSHHEQNAKMEIPDFLWNQPKKCQNYVVGQIKDIFQSVAQKTFMFRQFSKKAKEALTFISMIIALEKFIAQNKILVAKKINKSQHKRDKMFYSPECRMRSGQKLQAKTFLKRLPDTQKLREELVIKKREKADKIVIKEKNKKIDEKQIIDPTRKYQDLSSFLLLWQKDQKQTKSKIPRPKANKQKSQNDSTPSSIDQITSNCSVTKNSCLQDEFNFLFADEDESEKEKKVSLSQLGRNVYSSTQLLKPFCST